MIIKAITGNLLEEIEKEQLDGIMNAANCKGPMGRGIAGAIKEYGGNAIQSDAYKICKKLSPQPGQAYSTIAGLLEDRGIKRIIHAATMYQPGGITSYDIVKNAFISALKLAKQEGIKRIGCTALGTGVGGLDSVEVAKIMKDIAEKSDMEIVFCDFDKKFIDSIHS